MGGVQRVGRVVDTLTVVLLGGLIKIFANCCFASRFRILNPVKNNNVSHHISH